MSLKKYLFVATLRVVGHTMHQIECLQLAMSCVNSIRSPFWQLDPSEKPYYISEAPCSEQAPSSCLLNAFNSPMGIEIRNLIILSRIAWLP